MSQHTPAPYEVEAITTHPPDLISFEFFMSACFAWGHWQISMGVPVEELQDPRLFVNEAEYDRYLNVVSNWPRRATMRPPSLLLMISDLRTHVGAKATSFAARLDQQYGLIEAWMHANGVDPALPNETKEERTTRLNRERVARYRQKNKMPVSDDPEEAALVQALREAAHSVSQGKSWLRERERDHKTKRDAAIIEARSACAKAIDTDRGYVNEAERLLVNAQAALDSYRVRK